MSYFRFVITLLLILLFCTPLIAEEKHPDENKLLPMQRFEGLHSGKTLRFAITGRKLILGSEVKDKYVVLDVSTGEEKDISSDIVGITPIHTIGGRFFYYCRFSGNAEDKEYRIHFRKYDLETKKWSDEISIKIAEGLSLDDFRMTTTVECTGTEAFILSTIHYPWPSDAFPCANAEKVRREEAQYLHVFLRADIETGKQTDKVTFCSGIHATPHLQVLGYDPFRRNMVKYDGTSKKLLFETIEGTPKAELDASQYFPQDEVLRAKSYESEMLIFGDSNYLLIDAEHKVKGVISNKYHVSTLQMEGSERIDRFSEGCYYVNRKDSADILLNFNDDRKPVTAIGFVYKDIPICDRVLYWSSRWGDLMRVSSPDFTVEVVKERYLWEESFEEHSFSGSYLFLPSCNGNKLKIYSALTGRFEKAVDYSGNPIVELAVAKDSSDRVALLFADGKMQVIDSISLAIEKEVLLRDCVDAAYLPCKLLFSKHQIIVLLCSKWDFDTVGFRFNFNGELLEKFSREDEIKQGFNGPEVFFTNNKMLSLGNAMYVSFAEDGIASEGIVSGGYLLKYTYEPMKRIDFVKTSLETSKETIHSVEWFTDADKVLSEINAEHGCFYSEPNLIVSHSSSDGLRIYCMNFNTGKVSCERITNNGEHAVMYIAPLSEERFLIMTFNGNGYYIYKQSGNPINSRKDI